MQFIESVRRRELKTDKEINFRAGDQVRVNFRIVEGGKERVQAFEGTVIRFRKGLVNASFTVRKISSGVGVERTFPIHSPRVESVDVISRGKVRRGRLYYLRELSGKRARIESEMGAQDDSMSVMPTVKAAQTAQEVGVEVPVEAPRADKPKTDKKKK